MLIFYISASGNWEDKENQHQKTVIIIYIDIENLRYTASMIEMNATEKRNNLEISKALNSLG